MTEVFDQSIQYQPEISNHPTPVYRNISPQGANSINLSVASSVGPVDFVIPPAPINLSRSRINFRLYLPSSNNANNRALWLNANLGNLFSRLVLTDTLTGATMCDLSNADFYMSLVAPAGTSIDDLQTKPIYNGGAGAGDTSVLSGVQAATDALASGNPFEEITRVVNVSGNAVTQQAQNYTGRLAQNLAGFTSPAGGRRQFIIGTLGAAAAAQDLYLYVSIPLSAFKMTIMSVDKLLYFPTNLNLSVYFSACSSFVFQNDSLSDATNGEAYATAGQPLISNLSITTCNEGNLALSSQIINKVMTSGLSLPFSYPTVSRFVAGASSTHSINLMLTRAYGSRILAILTAGFETSNANVKVHRRGDLVQYNTFLNNVAILNQAGFQVSQRGEDYIIGNVHFLTDSAVQNSAEYSIAEWIHIDSWMGLKKFVDMNKDQTKVDGLSVDSQNSTWSLTATTTGNRSFNWINCVLGQKVLTISNQGATVI